MAGSGWRLPLYGITEVREITRTPSSEAKSVMSSSVIPSVKYSWVGSFERFSNGMTAIERTCGPDDAALRRSRQFPRFQTRAAARAMAAAAASSVRLPARARARETGGSRAVSSV